MMTHEFHSKKTVSRHQTPKGEGGTAGFTILEVVLSISILLTLSIAATTVIRNSLSMRAALANQGEYTHKMSMAMQKIADDLAHVFIIDTKRAELNPGGRRTKALFRVKRDGETYGLKMTVMNHQPRLKNSHESDQALVVYEVKPDETSIHGKTSLYRGETKVIPEDGEEEIPMAKMAEGIKSLKVWCWDGQKWSDDSWDTTRSDWRNKLPHMIKIELEAYETPLGEAEEAEQGTEPPTSKLSTVVYLDTTYGTPELKQRNTSPKWEGK